MVLPINHLAWRKEFPAPSKYRFRKGSPRSRQSKRWSNFLTLVIATAALQFHRRSSDWCNFQTREGVFQMVLPISHVGRREVCPTGVAPSKQTKIRKVSSRSRKRRRWSNFLTLVIAIGALQFHRRSCNWSNFLTRKGVGVPDGSASQPSSVAKVVTRAVEAQTIR